MLYKRNRTWWYSFTWNGRRYQESTGLENRKAAEEVEAGRRVQLSKGEVGLQDRPRYTINELLDRLKQRWQLEGKCSRQNESLLKMAKAEWGTKMADEVTGQDLERYALKRRKQEYATATTNRIFQCIRRAYKLAGVPWPDFELPSEAGNTRQGFLSPAQMVKVLNNLPDDGLRDFIRFGYSTGTRRNEVAHLTWAMVDGDELHIPGDICKNREARILPLTGELGSIIKRRKAAQSFKLNGGVQLSEFIFHREGGKPILEFRRSWRTACRLAGCGNMLPADMRRSAARDMIRSGVPESVAMKITGHKTSAMFRRYNITAQEDVKQALEKTAAYRTG